MRIIQTDSYEEMSLQAADMIAAQVMIKPDAVLGLATGSTPVGTYEELVRRCTGGRLDFSRVRSVNLDEYRGLAPENVQSFRFYMNEKLFSRINIDPANTHVPDGMAPDPHAACAAYDRLIEDLGGIDLQLLGIGRNGHIGFNEPAADFAVGTHVVDLTPSTIRANARMFSCEEEVPRQALTVGMRAIMGAARILLIANGPEKAQVLHEALYGPVTPQLPASILQLHPDVTVIMS